MKHAMLVFLLGAMVSLAASGCAGTGNPWTKELRVAVLGLTGDGSAEVPVTGASVTVSKSGGTGGGSGSTGSQTLATGSDGTAMFRVEPGFTYSVAVTATGYSTGQLSVDVGFFAGTTMTRTITLAPTGT